MRTKSKTGSTRKRKRKRRDPNHAPIDSKHAGIRNERLVLALLRQHGQLSQAQLCRLAGLSSSTASYIVGRLRQKNLIIEERGESSKRGAKPVIIRVRPGAQLAVGVEVDPTSIFIGLFDFKSTLIETVRVTVLDKHAPQTICNLVEINVRGLLSKHNARETDLLGIGLSVSGAISRSGVVQLPAPMGWKDVPIQRMLQDRFQAPVFVFTTRVRMFAEISRLPSGAAKHLVLLNFADGVGASVAEHGRLIHGATNRAGEIGHIDFDPAGPRCGCGHRGCLETFASGPALARRITNDIERGASTVLSKLIKPKDTPKDILAHFGRAVDEGDEYALEVRELLAEYVGRATAIAINCYDPDALILTGYVVMQCPDYLAQAAQERFSSEVFDHYSRTIEILVERAGEESLIRGIATAVLNRSAQAL